jgi:predicted metalloprotease with PDZ domain
MYIDGHKPDPLTLTVESPAKWKLISGFSESLDQRTFTVRDYDLLVDTPMEVSADCQLDQFQERGKTIRVAVHSYGESDREEHFARLVEGLKKIVRAELASMPEPDFSTYTFIFHFAPDIPLGDGMEHLNSSQVIIRGTLGAGALNEALETAAHEFFHLWNGKRLRPAGLGPFDYTRENYSRSLWFAEGVTTYYSYLFLLRAGLWRRTDFLARLAAEIQTLEGEPGRRLMSAESSSFHAWFYDRSPQMQETNFANSTISYYNKGAVLGLLLDLEIRGRSGGTKTLDDLLRLLYEQFHQAPAESYYGPGYGYREEDILAAASKVAGSDLRNWFARFVQGTDELPYAETLARAGLRLRAAVARGSPPSLGVLIQRLDRGLRITAVRPGQAADRAGLAVGDILLAVDTLSLATTELNDRLKIYPPGAEVPFTVERRGREEFINVTLDPPPPNLYALEDLPGATAEQKEIRKAWLASGK